MVTRYTPRASTSRDDDEGDDVSHFPETKTLKREEEAASAERRRRMRRVKGVSSGKGHFLFLRAREKCARVCVYSLPKNDDCSSFLSCRVNCKYLRFGPKYKTQRVSLFLSLLRSIYCSQEAASLSRASALLFLLPRRTERILRPLVLGTLLRASSLRSRGARNTERKRCLASCQEALSPLRLSI